jgi:hypothetical protein
MKRDISVTTAGQGNVLRSKRREEKRSKDKTRQVKRSGG